MNPLISLLFLCFFISFARAQCTTYAQTIDYMVTGVVQLGLPQTFSAQEDYNIPFPSQSNLGSYAKIFSAFAITGLQTASNQGYYSVTVDQVYFTNSNSAMRIIMDYYNSARTIKTNWNKIKLSYLVLSPQFQGISTGGYVGNSYIWASSVQLTPPLSNQPIDTNILFSHNNDAGTCGYVDSFPAKFGTNCPGDAQILYHYYVMGFRYDSNGDNGYEVRLSVEGGNGNSHNQSDFNVLIGNGVTPNGPYMTVNDFGGRLDRVKVAMVVTVLRDYSTYPTQSNNPQTFKYSGIYMPVNTFNNKINISPSSSSNLNFFDIGYSQNKIYGFSSLQIKSSNSASQINFNLQLKDLYTLTLQTSNTLTSVQVSSDIYANDLISLQCLSNLQLQTQVRTQRYSSIPFLSSNQQQINKLNSANGILPNTTNQYVFELSAFDIGSDSSMLTYTMELSYGGLETGRAYEIQVGFNQLIGSGSLPNGWSFRYSIMIEGQTVFVGDVVTDANQNNKIDKIGKIINNSTVKITLMIVFHRSSTQNITFRLNFAMFQIQNLFDPSNNCCSTTCPTPSTNINLNTNPYTCVQCTSQNNQFYNSKNSQCQCVEGYYAVSLGISGQVACYPCNVGLCAKCTSSSPGICSQCVLGAQLDVFGRCQCGGGLVEQDNTCVACSYRCDGCSVHNQCTACADPSHRDILNHCACIDGYFDNGSSTCTPCSPNCITCLGTATNCTSCSSNQNKQFFNGQCICKKGYFPQISSTTNQITCVECAIQCDECSGTSESCTFCNASNNKIPGYDSNSQLTCVCKAGYFLDQVSGDCIQSDCANDPFCAQCEGTTPNNRICVACKTSLNRVLQSRTYKCVCQAGYYENANKQCVSCAQACATCTNAITCQACVAGAIRPANSSQLTCQCSPGSFFTTQPTRYCKTCAQNCQRCDNDGKCISCLASYQLAINGSCVCGLGRYNDNQTNQCLNCTASCATCQNQQRCLTCINNYLFQNGQCVQRCSLGFYRSGLNCLNCPKGCSLCSQANQCIYCQNGLQLFEGKCHETCPAGSIAQTGTGKCIPCNSPCRTCTLHPSRCTSCQANLGNLFEGQCMINCPSGTFAQNGNCQYCSFQCATCLGTPRYCTTCAEGKYLFNGACFDRCPQVGIDGRCAQSCPSGFYLSSAAECTPCPAVCQECSSASQCTKCSSSTFSYQGNCLKTCPNSTYVSPSRECLLCHPSCLTCHGPLLINCLSCPEQSLYNPSNQTCSANQTPTPCPSNQFVNPQTNRCQLCNSSCLSCQMNANNCLSCRDNYVPINGRCQFNNCLVENCAQCSTNSECLRCFNGFILLSNNNNNVNSSNDNNTCVRTCPYPLVGISGKCQCRTGIFYNGQCLNSCPQGYALVDSLCQKCQPPCLDCSQAPQYCTSCQSGYTFNPTQRTCQQISPLNCPYGQFLEGSTCRRHCPAYLVYINGLCYYNCLTGYINNGQGGCVPTQQIPSDLCPNNQYKYQNACVITCPNRYFGGIDLGERVCLSCGQNCQICDSSVMCVQCQNSYRVKNGLCQKMIVENPNNTACAEGFYFNQGFRVCLPCSNNCSTCTSRDTCLSCSQDYSLVLGQCVKQFNSNTCNPGTYRNSANQCINCPTGCKTCISAAQCTSCQQGYLLNTQIQQCYQKPFNLQQLTNIRIEASYLRGSTVIVSVLLPVMPNVLTERQKNNFFTIKQSSLNSRILTVRQWQSSIDPRRMFVAIRFVSIEGSSFLFLSVNDQVMGGAYAQLGYKVNPQAFRAVSLHGSLQQAPSTIQIPSDAQAIVYN